MTILVTQNLLDCSSISAIETSEFKIILTFKVVDLRVFFNLQLESAQSDGQNMKLGQNWNLGLHFVTRTINFHF